MGGFFFTPTPSDIPRRGGVSPPVSHSVNLGKRNASPTITWNDIRSRGEHCSPEKLPLWRKATERSEVESFMAKENHTLGCGFPLAQTVGFEPTCRFTDKLISSQPRYDHFDTSAYEIRTL